MDHSRRATPRVDVVLSDPRLRAAELRLGRDLVRAVTRETLSRVRVGEIPPDGAADAAVAALPPAAASLTRVINATGVLVHTNLGRAPLSEAAVTAAQLAAGATDVEFDLDTGRRAQRGRGAVEALLAAVPDAEAVHVVNNNAAGLALAATALAQGREILLSRGEFVEIGDGFRLSDLLASTGARLREVGTTNRTGLADYAAAIGPDTALILKVHPSNFRVEGFTSSVLVDDLATLGPPVLCDIGSGLLHPEPGLPDEPDATSALRAGAALVAASGDKLLGGPQAGLLFGRADLVTRLRRHPLARALRVDKLTLAALEATVRGPVPPVLAALRVDVATLRTRATRLAAQLPEVSIVDSEATVGGGGAPGVVLPSVALALPAEYAPRLRRGRPPVVGRISGDRCLLDLRGVDEQDDHLLTTAIRATGV